MRKLLPILLLCVILVFAGCGDDIIPSGTEPAAPTSPTVPKLTFTRQQVKLSEADDSVGAVYGINKDMEIAQWNGVTYAFEPSISLEDREACICATDMVLNRTGAEKELQINIYAAATYDMTFIQEGMVFTYLQDWQSPEYIAALLQGLFGAYCNYGAAYGYGSYLGNAVFGLPLKRCEANWTFDGAQDVLDLNILCFHIRFSAGKDVKAAKRIANTFADDYIRENGEAAFQALLVQSGSVEGVDEFVDVLSDFYASWNIDYTPSGLLYRSGGKGYDYIVKSKYAVMYMEQDWTDTNTGIVPLFYDGFLHQNYSETKEYFTTVVQEMGQYQALFGLDSYNNDLTIYFTQHYYNGRMGYNNSSHYIALPNVSGLSMLYVASLNHVPSIQEEWALNGMPSYFSFYYNHYGNAARTYIANLDEEYESLRYYRAYRDYIGRDVDMAVDFGEFAHFYAYRKGFDDPNAGGSDAFIAYLVSRFGEENVIDIVCRTHDFGEYTYDELVADWKVFLRQKFEDGT